MAHPESYEQLDRLTQLTTDTALEELRRRNTLTEDHAALVQAISATLIALAHGLVNGRYACVAPVGFGKTTIIKAAIKVLATETTDTSLLVLQERIEAGRETIADLDRMGVDPAAFGHVHHEADGMGVADAASRRFVFATHARARLDSIVPLLAFNEKRRAVVVDEALHASWAIGLRTNDLNGAIRWAQGYYETAAANGRIVEGELVAWASDVQARLFGAMQQLAATDKREGHVTINAPNPDFCSRFLHRLRTAKSNAGQPLSQLIEAATIDDRFRLLRQGQGASGGILQHRRILPQELRSCIIMDAGAEVDQLAALDDAVQLAHQKLPYFAEAPDPAKVKDWSEVEVWRMSAPGGRSTMREQFRAGNSEAWAPRAVAEFVRDRCPAEGTALLCTYKSDHKADYRRRQEEALTEAGVDLNRIQWTHWGAHDATNAHQDAVAVVAVGVWHLDMVQLTAWAMGQMNQPEAPIPTAATVARIHAAWQATSLYQLAGRGRARTMEKGKARPMIFAYIHRKPAHVAFLRQLMPGAVERVWPSPEKALPQHVRDSATAKTATAIREELRRLAREGVLHISTRALKRQLRLNVSSSTLSEAVNGVLKTEPWTRRGRSLVHAEELFRTAS